MIAAKNNGVQVESTLTSDQKVDMGIDPTAMAHIMSILTDLYSYRELAVLREYSTNAWDAHREAYLNRPIEVTLPTGFNPFLVIRDFGVGLSVEDIHRIYSQYGASTKRGTNDQVGMLGLGCKSALTYTTQFTVTSVKAGTKVQVVVSRDEDGAGSMHIADTSTTTDPDGTAVTVPVLRNNRFADKAARFFSYWEQGSVLVDGKVPARIVDTAMKVTDNLYVVTENDSYAQDRHVVVMGGVAYPAPSLDVPTPAGYSVVAFVPIGSVNFAPSREALMDTSTTTATLQRVVDEYKQGIVGVVERKIRGAKSHADAIDARDQWRDFIDPASIVTYKGEAIPTMLEHPQILAQGKRYPDYPTANPTPGDRPYEITSRYYKTKTDGTWQIQASNWKDYVWVHGWDYAKLSRTQAAKIEKYLLDNSITRPGGYGEPTVVLHPDKYPHAKWLRPDHVVDWATIDAVVLPKQSNGTSFAGQRKTGSFDCYVNGAWTAEVDANDIDTKHAVYYYAGPQAWHVCSRYNEALVALGKKFTIVTMPRNRFDKFLRDFPKAKNINGALNEAYTVWRAALTPDHQAALAMQDAGIKGRLARLDAKQVDDPAIKEAIRIAKIDLTKIDKQRSVFSKVLAYGTVKTHQGYTSPLAKYPLYSHTVADDNPTHIYWYLNAAFTAASAANI